MACGPAILRDRPPGRMSAWAATCPPYTAPPPEAPCGAGREEIVVDALEGEHVDQRHAPLSRSHLASGVSP